MNNLPGENRLKIPSKFFFYFSVKKIESAWLVSVTLLGMLLGYCWLQTPGTIVAALSWTTWTLILWSGTASTVAKSGRRWFMAGMGVRAVAFHWIPGVLAENYDIAYPLALLLFVLMIVFESVSWLLLGLASFIAFRQRRLPVWVIPSLVIILDQYWPRIFPWTMGHMLIGVNTLVQVVDIGGVAGLTWLMTAVSCVIVNSINIYASRRRGDQSPESVFGCKSDSRFGLAVLILLLFSMIYGACQQSKWNVPADDSQDLRVAAIQVDSSWVRAEERLCELSLSVEPSPDLVIWPESSLGVYSDTLTHFLDDDYVYERSREPHCSLPGYAVPGTSLLACGVTYTEGAPLDGPYRNTSLLINDQQTIIGKYVKRSLLPFGEYVPGQSLVPALRHFANIDRIRECGTNCDPMITSKGLSIGAMICYDDVNPVNARETVARGAQLLTVQVNAADYDNPVALRQHCLLARLRSVENRRYFVRCASTGITCIISPTGIIQAESEPQTEAIVTGTVRPYTFKTLYCRLGEFPVYVSLVLMVFKSFMIFRK